MLDLHHLTLFCTHERGGVVAITEVVALLAGHFLITFPTAEGVGIHGDECLDAVAAMDVQGLSDGAKSVCGIDVASILLIVFQTPMQVLRI